MPKVSSAVALAGGVNWLPELTARIFLLQSLRLPARQKSLVNLLSAIGL